MNKFLTILFLITLSRFVQAKEVKILSPDKKILVTLNTEMHNKSALNYSVMFQGSVIIAASPLGLELEGEDPLSAHLEIVSVKIGRAHV